MITLSNVSKTYGDQTLFEGATLQFNPGERYGIVGANGCGKSTLLKILAGEETASDGEVTRPRRSTLGVLKQDHFQYEADRIIDVVMMGDARALAGHGREGAASSRNAEDRVRRRSLRRARGSDPACKDGYSAGVACRRDPGRPGHPHRGAHANRSRRYPVASSCACSWPRCLRANPDVLLLDEPTNHLDILSIRWLEKLPGRFSRAQPSWFLTIIAFSTMSLPRSSWTSTTPR